MTFIGLTVIFYRRYFKWYSNNICIRITIDLNMFNSKEYIQMRACLNT